MEKEIRRCYSAKDIVISLMFIVAGFAVLMFKSAGVGIFGVSLIALGLLLLVVMKSAYLIEGRKFTRLAVDGSRSDKERLLDFLSSGQGSYKRSSEAGGLLVYVYVSNDKNSGYAQLFEYANYEYVPCTDLVPVNGTQIAALTAKSGK